RKGSSPAYPARAGRPGITISQSRNPLRRKTSPVRVRPHSTPAVDIYGDLVRLEVALALVAVLGVVFITALHGRHGRSRAGPEGPGGVGWIVMEAVSPLVFLVVFLLGVHRASLVPVLLLVMWQTHYLSRSFVYPSLMRPGRRMP